MRENIKVNGKDIENSFLPLSENERMKVMSLQGDWHIKTYESEINRIVYEPTEKHFN